MSFNKANVVMLPTDQKTNGMICKDITGQDKIIAIKTKYLMAHEDYVGHHLYIISDDEIKKGDWVIEYQPKDNLGELHQIHNEYVLSPNIQKKVIATTDTTLELPRLSQQFIEEYIEEYNKGQQITECLVEYEEY